MKQLKNLKKLQKHMKYYQILKKNNNMICMVIKMTWIKILMIHFLHKKDAQTLASVVKILILILILVIKVLLFKEQMIYLKIFSKIILFMMKMKINLVLIIYFNNNQMQIIFFHKKAQQHKLLYKMVKKKL